MPRKCILISSILLTLCLCNNALSAEVITEHVCLPSNEYWSGAGLLREPNNLAQAFEVTGSPTITEVVLDLYRFQDGTGNVTVELRPDSDGVPSSEVEASVCLPVSDVPDTSEYFGMPVSEIPWGLSDWTSFQWGPGGSPTLSAGKWWIVCYLSSDSGAFMNWGGEKQGWDYSVEPPVWLAPYGTWNDTAGLNDDGTWSVIVSLDMNFRVIGGIRETKTTNTTVTADQTTVGGGAVPTIEVSVDAVGSTVAGLVTLSAPNGGTLGNTTLSLINGSRTTTWTAPQTPGTYNIEAFYQGQEYGLYNYTDSNGSVEMTVEPSVDPCDTDTYQTLEPTSTEALQTIDITVNVKDETTGNSIEGGGTVTFSCDEGGTFFGQNPWSCTVVSGLAAAQWKAPGAGGTFTIHANYNGCTGGAIQYGPSSDSDDVTVDYVERDTTTTVSVSPDEPYVGKIAYVTVRVEDAESGMYVPSGIVMLEDDAPYGTGRFEGSLKYIQDGKAQTIWHAPGEMNPGQYTITATYLEDGTYNIANGIRYRRSDANTTVNVVKDSDGAKLTYMSEWIADYNCCDWGKNLPNAGDCSQGFTDRLETDLGWTGKEYPNKKARAKHMRGLGPDNKEDSYMDTHDFTWYLGHGSPDHITFTHPEDDRQLYWSDGIDSGGNPTWGDKDAEWLALMSCKVLSMRSSWAATMDGLHLICGFHTNGWTSTNFPRVFAELMIKDGFDDEPKTIKQAWFLAADQTLPNWITQIVIGETENILKNDHIWGQGKVCNDPSPNNDYWFSWNYVSTQSPVADAGGPYTAVAGQPIELDGSGTTDPDTDKWLLSYRWDLDEFSNTDDGDWDLDGSNEDDDDCDVWGCYPDACWPNPGNYRIRLMVRDDTSNVDDDWADVTVNPAPASASISGEPIAQTQSNGGIEIVDKFPSLPTEVNMPLFGVGPVDISYYEMMNIAKYWKMTCDSAGLDAVGNWNMVDGNHELMVNQFTGSVMYIDRDNAYKCPEESILYFDPAWLPDPCQARDLAETFLSENDIMIDPSEMVFENVSNIADGLGTKGSRFTPVGIPFQRRVNYRRNLNVWRPGYPPKPYPVVGPGGKLSLNVDVRREVVMFVKIWREVGQDMENVPALNPAALAIDDFHRLGPKALLPACWVPPCTRIDIDNVSLGYYEDDFVTEQDTLYPVYILDLTCHKDEISQQVQVYMSAMEPPLEAVIESPASPITINYGEETTFAGSAIGGTLPYTYKWASDVDGLLSTGPNFVTSSLSVNYLSDSCICEVLPSTISLTVTDAHGFQATGFVNVTVLGFCSDFNRDGTVNFKDFAELASFWLAQLGEQTYDEKVDFNGDSVIDLTDLCILNSEWLQ